MPKSEAGLKKRKASFPTKIILVFIIGLVLGAVIQLMFVQPMLDNSPSFKSQLAECESSREIADKEIQDCFDCLNSHNLNPNKNCS